MSNKIKVMQVIHGLSMGGAETLVKEYALTIDNNKFDFTILCFEHFKNCPYEFLLEQQKIKIIYIEDYQKYYHKKGLVYKVFNHLQRYYFIKKIIKNEQPDILHTHLPINKYIKYAKPIAKTKIVHTVHSDPQRYWPSKKNKDYKAAQYLVRKYGMKFICLHDEMKTEVNNKFNVNNSIVLNNGIDVSKFKKVHKKNTIKNELKIPIDAYIVGHIGRFNRIKNHSFLVDIFNSIYNKNKSAFLLMIGSGDEKTKIINKLEELHLKDRYLILENRTDIPDLLNIIDVFVFPSIKEGIPLSLIEVQESKTPSFVSEGVSDSAIISNIVTKLPLNIDCQEWANIILKSKIPQKIIINDDDWDINKIVKKLEKIYYDEVNEGRL